jgi:hypothetical protein
MCMASRLRQRKLSVGGAAATIRWRVCFACDRRGPGKKLSEVDCDGDTHKRFAALRDRNFRSHVVTLDAKTRATLGGWSCAWPGRAQFDGAYEISRLPVGYNHQLHAEPLANTVYPRLSAPPASAPIQPAFSKPA